jgi:hypothetical protein
LCGCEGDFVNLGHSPLVSGGQGGSAGGGSSAGSAGVIPGGASQREWLEPTPLFAQEERVLVSNPSFNEQEKFVVYTEELRGDDEPARLYARALAAGAWSSRVLLDIGTDTVSPALSGDGSLLWFGQNVAGGLGKTDIYFSRSSGDGWSEPVHLDAPLNSERDDVPRPPTADGTLMPLSSKRHGGVYYQIYLATRSSASEPWQNVSSELLGTVNSSEYESVDGFLAAGGLELYYSSTRNAGQGSDLFVARRSSLQEAFGEPQPLDVNTRADERDPWLSTDRRRLYFTSDRPTADFEQYTIYMSARAR